MVVKTPFSEAELAGILSRYDLGEFVRSKALTQGTVQTNYLIQTTLGKFVFRYYENRSTESVLFESELLTYLTACQYPCPAPRTNKQGTSVGVHQNKPYMILGFIAGQHIEQPSQVQKLQLVEKAAELQRLTMGYYSNYTRYRWNYEPELCDGLARAEADKIGTEDAHEKYGWLSRELSALHLSQWLPKAICHCDFHFSNVLFYEEQFVALIDFDDANYTYAQFDLVGLIEYWAWPNRAHLLDLGTARSIVQEYARRRPLSPIEQQHLYDVYKLGILFDCVWYFKRGTSDDFRERNKIDALTDLGRQRFYDALF